MEDVLGRVQEIHAESLREGKGVIVHADNFNWMVRTLEELASKKELPALHYWEKQLILYTKGHFKRLNYAEDLKWFPAELYGLEVEQVSIENVFHMVVDVYETLGKYGFVHFELKEFLASLFRGSSSVQLETVIRQLLSEIQGMSVANTGLELGEADKELAKRIQA